MSDKKLEKWQLQELVDEAVASGEIIDEMLNQYVYSFKQSGRDIEDLTADAYDDFALEYGITTLSSDVQEYHDDKGILMAVRTTVIVGIPEDDKPEQLWQKRHGTAYELAHDSRGFDRFCFAKSMTKARRNAIKQFVPAMGKSKLIAKLKGVPMSVGTPQQAIAKPNPNQQQQRANGNQRQQVSRKKQELPPPTADQIERAQWQAENEPPTERSISDELQAQNEMEADNRIRTIAEMHAEPEPKSEVEREGYLCRYCFALWNAHNPTTGDARLPATFWENVKEHFQVKSRTEMTIGNWQSCLEQMKEHVAKTKVGHYDFAIEETHSGLMQPEDSEAETTEIGGNGE